MESNVDVRIFTETSQVALFAHALCRYASVL